MKLKTLKDIEYSKEKYCVHTREQLKQEAIKWIKAFQKGERHTDYAADGRNGQENVIEWIEDFFNIYEEDLNEKENK